MNQPAIGESVFSESVKFIISSQKTHFVTTSVFYTYNQKGGSQSKLAL